MAEGPLNAVHATAKLGKSLSKAKKWFEGEMAARSNVITEKDIVWDWDHAEKLAKDQWTIRSIASTSKRSYYHLEIQAVNDGFNATVYVLTPMDGFIREVAMTLDGEILQSKKLDTQLAGAVSDGLLPRTAMFI